MKIIVFSDSHGNYFNLEKVVLENQDTDLFLHLGDCVAEFEDLQSVYPKFIYESVYGNCDDVCALPDYKIILAKKKRLLITHGHRFCVNNGLDDLKDLIKKQDVDLVFYGHTHVPTITLWNDRWLVNPGSIALPRQSSNEKTYAEILITPQKIEITIKTLDGVQAIL